MTGVTPVPSTDPFTATAPGERHLAYGALAAAGPVHRITLPSGAPTWLIVGHDEVRAALVDPRLVKVTAGRPSFGPTNVGVWRTSVALEARDFALAVRIAEGLRPELLPSANRKAIYWADYGRALARLRGR